MGELDGASPDLARSQVAMVLRMGWREWPSVGPRAVVNGSKFRRRPAPSRSPFFFFFSPPPKHFAAEQAQNK